MKALCTLVIGLLLLCTPLAAPAQEAPGRATIYGQVTDAVTGTPLQGAAVRLVNLSRHAFTDDRGTFVLADVPSGEHEVRVQQLGYSPLHDRWTIGTDGVTEVSVRVRLAPQPILMQGIQVQTNRLESRLRAVGYSTRVFGRNQLLSRPALNGKELVLGVAGLHGFPCPLSTGDCVRVRGANARPGVWIDERPTFDGLEALEILDPHELYRIEVYAGGRYIRVYTVWFMETIASQPSYRPMPLIF